MVPPKTPNPWLPLDGRQEIHFGGPSERHHTCTKPNLDKQIVIATIRMMKAITRLQMINTCKYRRDAPSALAHRYPGRNRRCADGRPHQSSRKEVSRLCRAQGFGFMSASGPVDIHTSIYNVCVYVYIYICVCMYTSHTHIHPSIHPSIPPSVPQSLHPSIPASVHHACMHACMHAYLCMYVCMYVCIVYTSVYTYRCVYIYTYRWEFRFLV